MLGANMAYTEAKQKQTFAHMDALQGLIDYNRTVGAVGMGAAGAAAGA
jgi:hypothetical protein